MGGDTFPGAETIRILAILMGIKDEVLRGE